MKVLRKKRRPRLANTPDSYFSALPVYRTIKTAEAKLICDEAEATRKRRDDRLASGIGD